ncbi:hypothetical protein ANN_12909 [Periplaneta americana]|uniref:Uncharacterized protein n=1 Tax=Periplaneta americana TaxID=6978 RepID=A0ABQ8TI23_PERAM|nr:hypothetical protein ANN_12909 [Periplaneta americana]
MAGLCEGGNEPTGSLKAICNTESYPAFAHIGLRENPGNNLNQVTCPDSESNPGHLVSRPDALTVTPRAGTKDDDIVSPLKPCRHVRCFPTKHVKKQELNIGL